MIRPPPSTFDRLLVSEYCLFIHRIEALSTPPFGHTISQLHVFHSKTKKKEGFCKIYPTMPVDGCKASTTLHHTPLVCVRTVNQRKDYRTCTDSCTCQTVHLRPFPVTTSGCYLATGTYPRRSNLQAGRLFQHARSNSDANRSSVKHRPKSRLLQSKLLISQSKRRKAVNPEESRTPESPRRRTRGLSSFR